MDSNKKCTYIYFFVEPDIERIQIACKLIIINASYNRKQQNYLAIEHEN